MRRLHRSCCLSFLLILLATFISSLESNNFGRFSSQLSDDVLGLIVLKSGLNDPTSALSFWNEDDQNACSWAHVECSRKNHRVTRLTLDGLGLSGRINRGLEKLKHLRHLSLSRNNLSGTMPLDVAFIPSLRTLNLSHNNLSGPVPAQFVNFASLHFLDLSENALSGWIPADFFNQCSNLRFISLGGNYLEGTIPVTIGKCSRLQGVNFSNNNLAADPLSLRALTSLRGLRMLDLSHNQINGTFPEGVSDLHFLKEMHLEGNRFEGSLPAEIGLCPHLNHLDLSNNLFSSKIPHMLQNLCLLTCINLSNNKFMGNFPIWVGNLSNLQYMDLSHNELTGTLPASLGNMRSLKSLILSNNMIEGEISEALADCTNLSEIKLNDNNLHGNIPARLFDLGLREINLSANKLVGVVPSGSSRLFEYLSLLDLSDNHLSGNLSLVLFSSLQHLNLSWNDFNSTLPSGIGNLRSLSVLDLRRNGLYGSIPDDLCNAGSLSVLQLDGNSLSGFIPERVGNCHALSLLSLSHNNLSGPIPQTISNLKHLRVINFQFNSLTGEIPKCLGDLKGLVAVNLSYNNLVGRPPSGGIFLKLDRSSLLGNPALCLSQSGRPCEIAKPLAVDPIPNYEEINGSHHAKASLKHRGRLLSIAAVIIVSSASAILIGVALLVLFSFMARRRESSLRSSIKSIWLDSPRTGFGDSGKFVFFASAGQGCGESIKSAEWILTKSLEIGRGDLGVVYKFSLAEGRTIAVKKLINSSIVQTKNDFEKEIRLLGKAIHPNVVRLLGYYYTSQLQLLLSDFVPHGSLQSKLYEASAFATSLPWATRFRIANGTANGLAYLHQCRPPIVHYNIKPSNILLNENNDPMLADFGLVRLLQKQHRGGYVAQSDGCYISPELAAQSLRIDEKCDVYGFGLVLLMLVTGSKPTDFKENTAISMIEYVRRLVEQGNATECVDPSLTQYPDDEVLPVLKLGLVCTCHTPSSRPSMMEVVQILQVIKTPVCNHA